MKKIITLLIVLCSLSTIAQNITLSFENPQITNDGVDDFYEVDVLIISDTDYIQGSGQFFLDYNTLAFGENIQALGGITYERPLTSILGSTTATVENYNSFIVNDNITSRVSFLWQQFWSSGAIGANNVTSVPTVLVHVKMKMIDSSQDPMVCFDDFSHPAFDDQFFTACGPTTFAGADCFNFQGTQIFDYQPDCSGAALSNCIATTTWNGTIWDNGMPNSTTAAIINGNYTSSDAGLGSIDACEVTVNLGFSLTISAGNYLKSEGNITVGGTLLVENGGSVVQVDDMAIVTNNGNILVNKETTSVGINGFSIIGSPMSLETREGVYVNQGIVRHHTTTNFVPNADVGIYDPMAENFADDNGNDWQTHIGALNPSEGYLVTSSNPGDPNTTINVTYSQGTLNNGIYTYAAEFYTDQNSSPNVLSNPYASAILVDDFITANSGVVDAVYFWEHQTVNGTDPNYPGYKGNNYDMGDISMRNLIGPNQAPNGGFVPGTTIASGQGFAIKALTTDDVTFNNAMRTTGPNDQYRNPNPIEIERMYLSLNNETYGLKSSMLVGFTENASEGFDSGYDAKRLATPISIYSVLDDMELAIQGRSTFNTDQIIPLGFRTQIEEEQTFTISLGSLEGDNLSNATVYLVDNLLHISTNLSEEDYTFTSNESNQKDRFVIVFEDEQLGNNEVSLETISLYPNPARDIVNISSPLAPISSVEVFDLRGRKVDAIKIDHQNSYQINLERLKSAIYFIKINTEKGTITKRIIKE